MHKDVVGIINMVETDVSGNSLEALEEDTLGEHLVLRRGVIARIITSNVWSALAKSSNGSPAQWDIGRNDQWSRNGFCSELSGVMATYPHDILSPAQEDPNDERTVQSGQVDEDIMELKS
uniref:Uncharacterized protein n=1 Tax=Romanomermis culicivorax TaxID=13658 RepID=A0A915JGE2_ROMCU